MKFLVLRFPIRLVFEEQDFHFTTHEPTISEAFDVQVSQLTHSHQLLGGYSFESSYPDSEGLVSPFGEMRFGTGDCEQVGPGQFDLDFYVVGPRVLGPKHHGVSVQNVDFHDKVRDFEIALSALIEEIRGINDPDKLDIRIKLLGIYAHSILDFIEQSRRVDQNVLPKELTEGFSARLKSVNWTNVSDQASKWAQVILKILQGLG